jgi:hypothetical protein
MASITKDPLLGIANLILLFLMGIMGLAGILALVGIPVVLVMQGDIIAAFTEEAGKAPAAGTIWMLAGVLVFAAGMAALGFLFFRHMKRIVDSVAEGDPFVPMNARRLTAMAWLMLAIQFVAIPTAGLGIAVASQAGENPGTVDAGFNMNGIIMVLTLFILARVFRKGAEMREELEGTV